MAMGPDTEHTNVVNVADVVHADAVVSGLDGRYPLERDGVPILAHCGRRWRRERAEDKARFAAAKPLPWQEHDRVGRLQIEATDLDGLLLRGQWHALATLQLFFIARVRERRFAAGGHGANGLLGVRASLVLIHAEAVARVRPVTHHGRLFDGHGLNVVPRGDHEPSVVGVECRRQDESLGLLDLEMQHGESIDLCVLWGVHRELRSRRVPSRHGIADLVPVPARNMDVDPRQRISEPREHHDDRLLVCDIHCRLQPHLQQEDVLLLGGEVLELGDHERAVDDAR
mmetsp:Transcript_60165/g.167884  ORF Transcript_60165/g.167884 Transcript_60165/m.167884 type:complete len:285 (+) Transcript_60165:950-1804(+)